MTATATITNEYQFHQISTLRDDAKRLHDAIMCPDKQHIDGPEHFKSMFTRIEHAITELSILRLQRGQDEACDPAIGTRRYEPDTDKTVDDEGFELPPDGDERVELTEAGEALIGETGETPVPQAAEGCCCGGAGCGCKSETLTRETTDGPIGEGEKLPDTPGSTPGEPIKRKPIKRNRFTEYAFTPKRRDALLAKWLGSADGSDEMSPAQIDELIAHLDHYLDFTRDNLKDLRAKYELGKKDAARLQRCAHSVAFVNSLCSTVRDFPTLAARNGAAIHVLDAVQAAVQEMLKDSE